MGFSSPTPPSIRMPPPAAHPSTLATAVTAGQNAKTVAEAGGADSTIKSTPQGVKTKATTAPTTLLGQ